MSTIFILAGSVVGFMFAMVSLVVGAGLTFAMLLWMGSGVIAALFSVAMSTSETEEQNRVAQSA